MNFTAKERNTGKITNGSTEAFIGKQLALDNLREVLKDAHIEVLQDMTESIED